jgi:thioredoxin 1|tara:strand:- start:750 stop:1010 length:261 start_codon:yes stop_codon:yes gene_type:complete
MDKGILYFTAPWCEPCRLLGPVLDQLQKQYKIPVKKYNTDYNAIETERYNIKSVPTLVMSDRQGNEIKRVNGGGMSINDILAWFNA